MQATTTAARAPSGRWRRVAPVVCGCALVGAAALVAAFDPAASGSRFPACQFKAVTGLWCPGCGLTRGFHELFNGHPVAALQHNVFIPLVLAAVVAGWWSWLRTSWGRSGFRAPRWMARPVSYTHLTLPTIYSV